MPQASEADSGTAVPEAEREGTTVYDDLAKLQVDGLTPEVVALPELAASASPTPESPVPEAPQLFAVEEQTLPVSTPVVLETVAKAALPELALATEFPPVPVSDVAPAPEAPPLAVAQASEQAPVAPAKMSWRERFANFFSFGRKKDVPVEEVPVQAELPVTEAAASPETPDAIRSAADATLALRHRFANAQPMERQRLVKDWIQSVSQLPEDQWPALVGRLGSTEPRVQGVVAESPVHLFGVLTEARLLSTDVVESLLPQAFSGSEGALTENAAQLFNEKIKEIQALLSSGSPDSSDVNGRVRVALFTYAKLTPDQHDKLTQDELSPEQGTEGEPISWTDALGTLTQLLLASEPRQASSS